MSLYPPPTVIWTALPYGTDEETGQYQLTVFVSPRLHGPGDKLGATEYEAFRDWPASVRHMTFSIELLGSPEARPATVATLYAEAEAYWQALFRADTRVRPYQFQDYGQRDFQSYSVHDTMEYVKTLYQKIAAESPFSTPPVAWDTAPDSIQRIGLELGRLRWKLESGEPPATDMMRTFEEVMSFFNRQQPVLDIELPQFEFHELVSALGDHPAALRRLCLAIDLRFSGPLAPEGEVRVQVGWPHDLAQQIQEVRPWTHYTLAAGPFQAKPSSGSEIDQGYLRLTGTDDSLEKKTDTKYELLSVDPDGAAIKLLNFADSVDRLRDQSHEYWPFDRPDEAGLPALRTGGLALVRRQRLEAVKDRLDRGQEHNRAADDPEQELHFHADDLLRGYRVDVWDDEDPERVWRSLCQRQGLISFPGTELTPLAFTDEGYVKSASTVTQPSGDADDQEQGKERSYLHEAMFKWDGWSLVARRPGLTLTSAATDPAGFPIPARLDSPGNVTLPAFPFLARYTALKGSLPRLRFGRQYRLAVRAVDLAGNSRPPRRGEPPHATRPVIYQRFEPVAPPALVPRAAYGEGESLEHLVIRSTYGVTVDDYTAAHEQYTASGQRHIVPPKVSASTAELHGMLDPWPVVGKKQSFQQAYFIALKEQGSLEQNRTIDIKTGREVQIEGAEIETAETETGHYVVHGEEQLVLPYLPDPAAIGVAFWQDIDAPVDGPAEWAWDRGPLQETGDLVRWLEGTIFSVPVDYRQDPDGHDVAWPEAWPLRLVLREPGENERDGAFAWDKETRELTILLGKARVLTLRYSSLIHPDFLKLFGVWHWLVGVEERITEANAIAGLLWMLTPYRTLKLVHAVQKPQKPWFQTKPPLSDRLSIGDVHASFDATIWQDTASTGKVELLAKWTDPVDDLAQPGPTAVVHQQQVHQRNVPPDQYDEMDILVRHEIGDTKYHRVEYSLRATTRFREYFPPPPRPSELPVPHLLDSIEHEAVKRAYEITHHTETSETQWVDVPNSARPAAPEVAYVLPTFGWKTTHRPNGFCRKRVGGGLRVYLERPWYSSGDGEKLAVVLWPPDVPLPDPATVPPNDREEVAAARERILKLTTHFALDPLRGTQYLDTTLKPEDFYFVGPYSIPFSAAVAEKFSLEEPLDEKDRKVAIAAFPVEYRQESERWFADLQIVDEKLVAYFPFIRLVLARYQENSLDDAHLSPVVLTDFVQLAPTRILTVRREPAKATICLEGYAPRAEGAPGTLGRNVVKVWAETHDPATHAEDDPLGWVEDTQSPFENLPVTMEALEYYRKASLAADKEKAQDLDYTVWYAEVPIPMPKLGEAPAPLRFVVAEEEVFPLDEEVLGKENRRVVYVDTIDIYP